MHMYRALSKLDGFSIKVGRHTFESCRTRHFIKSLISAKARQLFVEAATAISRIDQPTSSQGTTEVYVQLWIAGVRRLSQPD
jgi:hypothetical protein